MIFLQPQIPSPLNSTCIIQYTDYNNERKRRVKRKEAKNDFTYQNHKPYEFATLKTKKQNIHTTNNLTDKEQPYRAYPTTFSIQCEIDRPSDER